MKKMTVFFTTMALVFAALCAKASQSVSIGFEGLSVNSTCYDYHLDSDKNADIIFKTDSPSGFGPSGPEPTSLNRIAHPALRGTISGDHYEVIVEFPGGATGTISFDFAVLSPVDPELGGKGCPEAWIQVYGKGEADRITAGAQASGIPAESTLEIIVPFVAHKALIDFHSGTGSVFILDNFRVTSGTTQAPDSSL